MKKIFTTLVALLIVGVGFAQTDVQPLIPGMETPSMLNFKPRIFNSEKDAKSTSQFWYSYSSGMAVYSPTTTSISVLTLFTDSVATVIYNADELNPDSTIAKRPQVYSSGMVFDFTSQMWNYFYDDYRPNGERLEAPYLGTDFSCGKTYSVDSIYTALWYMRNENSDPTVVDTLVITVGAATIQYQGLKTSDTRSWSDPQGLTYDPASVGLKAGNTLFGNNYEIIKLPLTVNDAHNLDTTLSSEFVFELKNFQNISKRHLAMTVGMISGIPQDERDTTMRIGTELNHIRVHYYKDGRPDFEQNARTGYMGSGFRTETNTPLTACEAMYQQDLLKDRYTADALWMTNSRRYLFGTLITCNDCCIVNVKDLEKTNKNITVRPNPATNNFTVELDDNSQAQVQLFNLLGQAVYNEQTNNQTVTVNVSNFNSGVYMLKVTQNGKVYTSKVLVQ